MGTRLLLFFVFPGLLRLRFQAVTSLNWPRAGGSARRQRARPRAFAGKPRIGGAQIREEQRPVSAPKQPKREILESVDTVANAFTSTSPRKKRGLWPPSPAWFAYIRADIQIESDHALLCITFRSLAACGRDRQRGQE
jgi:hypothetical protein